MSERHQFFAFILKLRVVSFKFLGPLSGGCFRWSRSVGWCRHGWILSTNCSSCTAMFVTVKVEGCCWRRRESATRSKLETRFITQAPQWLEGNKDKTLRYGIDQHSYGVSLVQNVLFWVKPFLEITRERWSWGQCMEISRSSVFVGIWERQHVKP